MNKFEYYADKLHEQIWGCSVLDLTEIFNFRAHVTHDISRDLLLFRYYPKEGEIRGINYKFPMKTINNPKKFIIEYCNPLSSQIHSITERPSSTSKKIDSLELKKILIKAFNAIEKNKK